MKKNILLIVSIFLISYTNAQTVTDSDGNIYNTVKIGTQTWFKENLATTKYNDGTTIQNITGNFDWSTLSTPAYCWYDNDSISYKDIYGALYNWYSVATDKLCPVGWHVPTNDELNILRDSLGGHPLAGGALKEVGTEHWKSPNTGATNESGFTALPSGYRRHDSGVFMSLGYSFYIWSSTEYSENEAYCKDIDNSFESFDGYNIYKKGGFSVRCLKDNITLTSSNSFQKNNNYNELFFYPNPATEKIYLKNINYTKDIVMIYDLQGQMVLSKQIESNFIELIGLDKGTYIIKIFDSENIKVNKLVVE